MKRFNIKFLAGGLLLLTLASCKKDNLEKFPASSIELSQSFQTVRDAKTWNTGLYSNLRGRVYGSFMYTTDVQADELNASADFGNRTGDPHRWTGFQADNGSISSIWSAYYYGITNANIQIAGFDKITPSAATTAAGYTERGDLLRYKADAYIARAYYYSQLIQLFAKPYEAATASSDPGVPLVLSYDVTAKPARASVKAVYDQILADITQAKTFYTQAKTEYSSVTPAATATSLQATITGSQGSQHFTQDVATALEARVRLNMQDWTGAKAAADALISSGRYPLITTASAYQDYWYKDTKTESIMQLYTNPATGENANTNSVYLQLNTSNNKFRPDWVPSQWVVDAFDNADIRKATFFASKPVDFTTGAGTLTLVNKYPGNPALFTATTTNYQHAPKVFRIAEMYLISAEAGARSGNAVADADALIKLNALRTARGLTALSGVTGTSLFAAVKDERFRELAFEGFRLNDLKRWHEGFTRHDPQNTTFLSVGPSYNTLSIVANDPRFVWGIPTNDVTINSNITQNPGW